MIGVLGGSGSLGFGLVTCGFPFLDLDYGANEEKTLEKAIKYAAENNVREIVDCVVLNRGTNDNIFRVNNNLLEENFALISSLKSIRYTYISSLSVLDGMINAYINSKKNAERFLFSKGEGVRILRIGYPLSSRLRSSHLLFRLMAALKKNEEIKLDDVALPFTLSQDIGSFIAKNASESKVINILPRSCTSLVSLVEEMKEKLNSSSVLSVNKGESSFLDYSSSAWNYQVGGSKESVVQTEELHITGNDDQDVMRFVLENMEKWD